MNLFYSLLTNYLAQLKKGEPAFDELPRVVRNTIDEYNKELVGASYEHKIKMLANLVNTLHSNDMKQPEVIDALQKEVRRNYEINFDAQFSHNDSFKLKCLGGISGWHTGNCISTLYSNYVGSSGCYYCRCRHYSCSINRIICKKSAA